MGLFSMPSCDWSCDCSCVSLLREETLVNVSSVWLPLGVTTRLELELGGVFGILSPGNKGQARLLPRQLNTYVSRLSLLKSRKISFFCFVLGVAVFVPEHKHHFSTAVLLLLYLSNELPSSSPSLIIKSFWATSGGGGGGSASGSSSAQRSSKL